MDMAGTLGTLRDDPGRVGQLPTSWYDLPPARTTNVRERFGIAVKGRREERSLVNVELSPPRPADYGTPQAATAAPMATPPTPPKTRMGVYALVMMASGRLSRRPTASPASQPGS